LEPRELKAVEKTIGVPLPGDFVEFLKGAHGGSLDDYVIDVPMESPTETEPMSFCGIYRVGRDEEGEYGCETVLGEIAMERESRKIPGEVVPFARDGGGSVVYLDLSAQGNGRVVAFVEGLPEWTGSRRESDLLVLADSFEEYVDKLYVDKEELREQLSEVLQTGEPEHRRAMREWLEIAVPDWRERYPDVLKGNSDLQ